MIIYSKLCLFEKLTLRHRNTYLISVIENVGYKKMTRAIWKHINATNTKRTCRFYNVLQIKYLLNIITSNRGPFSSTIKLNI